ncbi:hypothetical protein C1Y63_06455 [Corynebacterium sp. 13CS0277]|uniref:helix-turn-helix transcriptional regulator n=1 Tax=Corynebacterium sp. 13CS0277 TaxID=2071994 RepID=UPI000D04019D|nr:helix-turn-helix transcriptional regulator [Corynebacterium sp. 13CS0277]PRQ11346.1 hypothetical protein C1Y63_06455 [Corynebacterium sp. 13CS0277]
MSVSDKGLDLHLDSYGLAFSARLRLLRSMRNLTQEELAHLAGVHRNQIVNLERNETRPGKPANPTFYTIYSLARALNVPVAVLLPGATTAVTTTCDYHVAADLHIDVVWPVAEEDTAPFGPAEVRGERRIDEHLLPGHSMVDRTARAAHLPQAEEVVELLRRTRDALHEQVAALPEGQVPEDLRAALDDLDAQLDAHDTAQAPADEPEASPEVVDAVDAAAEEATPAAAQ